MKKRIVILASGSGSNAEAIVKYFLRSTSIEVAHIMSNREKAFVLERAARLNVPASTFNRNDLYENGSVKEMLRRLTPDLIVLAGFLWLLPADITRMFAGKIINIHPALLPAFGGKGMYGAKVHEAVISSKSTESGISIHYVNEHYDEGDAILQVKCPVFSDDTCESLATRIHELEHRHYPVIIEQLLTTSFQDKRFG
jgi:phosphoribosylglycinamide formyltransferase 1